MRAGIFAVGGLVAIAAVALLFSTSLILLNQKSTINTNLNMLFDTNEGYRALVTLLYLEKTYLSLSLSDYYPLSEEYKEFLAEELNRTLYLPQCLNVTKEDKNLVEFWDLCKGKLKAAVVPLFVPGMKVESLYINYIR